MGERTDARWPRFIASGRLVKSMPQYLRAILSDKDRISGFTKSIENLVANRGYCHNAANRIISICRLHFSDVAQQMVCIEPVLT